MPDLQKLIDALVDYEQADLEGVIVVVSRQACEEAAAALRTMLPKQDPDSDKPFTLCGACDSPILTEPTLGLVMMFPTLEAKQDFVEAVAELPNMVSHELDVGNGQ